MERIRQIRPADKTAYALAKARWDSIAKPLGSFGLLEEAVQRIAAVQGTESVCIDRRAVIVLCADHGVVAQGVTQCGSEVTAECACAIAQGRSNVNAIAESCRAQVIAADLGMVTAPECDRLLNRRIGSGTRDMTRGAAMTREQAEAAIVTGMELVRMQKEQGMQLLLTGEMGIGNTTAASALAAVLLGLPVREVTGRGAGLSSEGLTRKIAAIERAIAVNQPDPADPVGLLQKLGGFEIAGMTGLFLGGAVYRIPVVIDGVISAAAAAIACRIAPLCRDYLLASHCSGEPAGQGLLRMIGLEPVIHAGLRLGEGTGGLLLVPLLDSTLALYRNAHRFEDTSIERYTQQQ